MLTDFAVILPLGRKYQSNLFFLPDSISHSFSKLTFQWIFYSLSCRYHYEIKIYSLLFQIIPLFFSPRHTPAYKSLHMYNFPTINLFQVFYHYPSSPFLQGLNTNNYSIVILWQIPHAFIFIPYDFINLTTIGICLRPLWKDISILDSTVLNRSRLFLFASIHRFWLW